MTGRAQGFTLIEMVVALALVGVLAMSALPLYEVTSTRLRESELRLALRTLRTALDAYKTAADGGQIAKGALESGYPPSLDLLVEGVDVAREGVGPRRLVFLRQIPRDPFNTDPALPPGQQWRTRSYASAPDDPQSGGDVFDIASRSPRVGTNGVPYGQW